jgi:hypothetical protein
MLECPLNERISGMAEPKQMDPQYEVLVITGLRAMLGDQKARTDMENVQSSDPETFRRAMAEAEARYSALSEEAKQHPARTLNALVATSAQLRAGMIFAIGPMGFLKAIPRMLRRLLWK